MAHGMQIPSDMDAIQKRLEAQYPKRCNCCRKVHTRSSWSALPFKGYQSDDVVRMEMRDCACGSTLVVELEVYNLAELQTSNLF